MNSRKSVHNSERVNLINLYARIAVLFLLLSQSGCAYFSGVNLPELKEIEYIQVSYSERPINLEHRIYDQNTIARVLLLLAEVNNGWRQPILTPMRGYDGAAGFVNHSGDTAFVLWFSGSPETGWWLGAADRTKEGGVTYFRNSRDDISKEISLLLISEQK